MRNEWQTSVLLDGYLYGLDNVGSAGPVTHLTCVNASTGERVWQQLRFGKSNLTAADGKLFLSTMKGEVVIVNASPTGYQELGRATVIETTRQAPVISNGRLYLRDNQDIVCIDLRN
ncbi:MAG: outer membrane protein assembly factor BamB family protein [Pirellulales bacterium]